MDKPLMGIIIGAMLILVGTTASTVVGDEAFSITTVNEEFDEIPGNETWNYYGTLNGTIQESDGNIIGTGENGTYTSDLIEYNTSIRLDQVVYETSNIREDDEVNLFVEYFNSDGVAVGSQEVNMTEEIDSFAFDEIEHEYSAYRFVVTTTDAGTGQELSINSLTFTVDVIEELTDDLPFEFSQFLTIIPIMLGLIIEVVSFTTLFLRW